MMIRSLLLSAAMLSLAACATPTAEQAAAPEGRDCFHADNVSGFNYIDPHTIKIRVGASRDYLLSTDWNARDLDWQQAIAVRSDTSWICVGNGLGVEIIGGEPRRTYPVNGITRAPEPEAPQGS